MKNKRIIFVNSNHRRRGIINTKNAFTLIELLAIIVILAIIAVITVPIILNIIENSKKGAATDSAYGYKDAVNKYYISELSKNSNYGILNGEYTVTNGTLTKVGTSDVLNIETEGTKPSSGSLTYENNKLTGGCLVIGDYSVTFNNDGTTNTEKGECAPIIPTMEEMCPGCKFIYTENELIIGTSYMPSDATDDYTDWTSGENSHPHFLGLIESTTDEEIIGRAFACGIINGTPFCLEGNDVSKYSYNVHILNSLFTNCNTYYSDSEMQCREEWPEVEWDDLMNETVQSASIYFDENIYNIYVDDPNNCVVSGTVASCGSL